MQISTSVQQTTEIVALTLSALTVRAVVSLRVKQDTPEIDKTALLLITTVGFRSFQAYTARVSRSCVLRIVCAVSH